ncbi:MAG: hypothetical protein WD055_02320 [Candidatus Dependentiae bacterium]
MKSSIILFFSLLYSTSTSPSSHEKPRPKINRSAHCIKKIAFNMQGTQLACLLAGDQKKDLVKIYDILTGKATSTFKVLPSSDISFVKFGIAVVASDKKRIAFYKAQSGKKSKNDAVFKCNYPKWDSFDALTNESNFICMKSDHQGIEHWKKSGWIKYLLNHEVTHIHAANQNTIVVSSPEKHYLYDINQMTQKKSFDAMGCAQRAWLFENILLEPYLPQDGASERKLYIRSISTGEILAALSINIDMFFNNTAKISHDGEYIAAIDTNTPNRVDVMCLSQLKKHISRITHK